MKKERTKRVRVTVSLTVEEYYRKRATAEDDAIAKASGRAARRLRIDDGPTRKGPR